MFRGDPDLIGKLDIEGARFRAATTFERRIGGFVEKLRRTAVMATSALPRGKVTDFLLKSETTFGTAPSGNWTKTFIYSFTPGFKQPYENDALLGLARHNNRDTTQPAPGLIVNDPGLVVPVDFNHIGVWLYALLGAASVSGVSDPYTHTFNSGLEVLPWRSHERKYANALFYQDLGQVANTLELEMSRAAGFQRATLGFMGQTEAKVTSTGGGTPAAAWAREDCPAALGVFKVNGTAAANIMSVKAKYDNKITPQDYVGNSLRSGFDLDSEATFDGSIDLRFTIRPITISPSPGRHSPVRCCGPSRPIARCRCWRRTCGWSRSA